MKCRICGAEYDPIKTKEKLTINWSYDGSMCFECAEKRLLHQNDEEIKHCLTSSEIGRAYKEIINRRIKILESLLEQSPINSEGDVIDELITLSEYRDVPPEDVAKDLWVQENIKRWSE